MTQNKSELSWVDVTIPRSEQFDDTYYSKADGYAETLHTFIHANNLDERFANTNNFTIAELGFGTGLNFLAVKRFWQSTAPQNAKLHFISFEQYPITKEDMLKSLSRWPELESDAIKLALAWSEICKGLTIEFEENTFLTVHIGDANLLLPKLEFKADAWFLDGFSPAKNLELWNQTLMQEVARCTASEGTFATYTSAGFVRRNLSKAGFMVSKQPGHAGKREMSSGILQNIPAG